MQRIEQRLAEPGDGLRNQLAGSLPQLLASDWELDRIAAYLYGERGADGQDTITRKDLDPGGQVHDLLADLRTLAAAG